MTRAIVSQSAHKWRFGIALAVAAGIHLAAVSFSKVRGVDPKTVPGVPADGPTLVFDSAEPGIRPHPDLLDPLPPPPVIDESYIEPAGPPPPVNRTPTKFPPFVRPRTNTLASP